MDEIANPVTGERVVFRPGDSNDKKLCFDFFLTPKGGVFVNHLHEAQTEVLRVRRGVLICKMEGGDRVVREGESIMIPPNTPHALLNGGEGEMMADVEFSPPGRTELFLRNYFGICRDGGSNATGDLPLPHIAVFMPHYGTWRGDIPRLAQRILFTLLKPVGWLLGYRSEYPRYRG